MLNGAPYGSRRDKVRAEFWLSDGVKFDTGVVEGRLYSGGFMPSSGFIRVGPGAVGILKLCGKDNRLMYILVLVLIYYLMKKRL